MEWSSCSNDPKYGALIIGKSEQKIKTQSHFGILDPLLGEGKWYDGTASLDLKYKCELFGNIWYLYSTKSILHLCKISFDSELIYNLSSSDYCDNIHLLRSNWSNTALLHVSYPHVILFLLLISFYTLSCNS